MRRLAPSIRHTQWHPWAGDISTLRRVILLHAILLRGRPSCGASLGAGSRLGHGQNTLAAFAIPLALLLIVQYLRFSYAIDAAQASIETQQENAHYLADKLGALTHIGGDEPSTSEIKNIEQRRQANGDGTLTLIKVIDVLPNSSLRN